MGRVVTDAGAEAQGARHRHQGARVERVDQHSNPGSIPSPGQLLRPRGCPYALLSSSCVLHLRLAHQAILCLHYAATYPLRCAPSRKVVTQYWETTVGVPRPRLLLSRSRRTHLTVKVGHKTHSSALAPKGLQYPYSGSRCCTALSRLQVVFHLPIQPLLTTLGLAAGRRCAQACRPLGANRYVATADSTRRCERRTSRTEPTSEASREVPSL